MSKNKVVIAIVDSEIQAENAVNKLATAGILSGDISVIMPDKHGTKDVAHEHNTKAPEGAVVGGASGGVLGGALGLLAGIGALAIPGFGPFIAAGPLMAALSGAAAGIPKHYVLAADWQPSPFTAQAALARTDGWRVTQVPGGHGLMMDAPQATAEVLLKA